MNVSPILSKDDYNIFEFVERKNNNNYLGQYAQNVGTQKSSAPITSSGSLCSVVT